MKRYIRHGCEGPQYDPYSYTEYVVNDGGDKVILHLGLVEYIKINKKIAFQVDSNITSKCLIQMFEGVMGISLEEMENEEHEKYVKCKKCGSTNIKDYDGMPGETLYICEKCHNICACDLDRSAIE